MKKVKLYTAVAAMTLIVLMSLSMFSVSSTTDLVNTTEASDEPAVSAAQDYGDLAQYEWIGGGNGPATPRFSEGPAPNAPDLLWRTRISGVGSEVSTWKGKAFARGGSNTVVCVDALTGDLIWQSDPGAYPMYVFMPAVWVLDDNYVLTWHYYGFYIYRISDGATVKVMTDLFVVNNVGAGRYWPYRYDMDTKTLYAGIQSETGYSQQVAAWDMSNPENPTLKWAVDRPRASEMLAVCDGKVIMGSYEWAIYALDAETGAMVWFKDIDSAIGYTGCFVPGNPNRLIAGCVSSKLYCFDTANGDILWEHPYGFAGFAAQGGGVGYGMYYEQYFNLDGLHYAAWDVETGEVMWDNLAGRDEVSVPYINPAIADGKVYIQVQRQNPDTGRNTQTTVCFDAYSGEPIFEIGVNFATPSIAYGNLYGGSGGYMYCFGPPADWSMFRGSADMPGVAEGQAGPVNLEYKWVFNTGGPVTSSASVVDGKVYIGSFDHNIYCLDAYSGEEIWSFETNDRVLATPAVWGGIVYSGIEDGTLYALDANTGALLFSRSGFATSDLAFAPAAFSIRSSPIISDDGRLFIGGMDHKIYCLNTLTGATLWQVQTGGPVGASAVVVDTPGCGSVVYIASTDMYLYAINANTGDVLWKAMTPHDDAPRIAQVPPIDPSWARSVGLEIFQICSVAPAPDLGLVFITGNRDYRDNNAETTVGNLFAFNMSNGELVWYVNVPGSNFGGASPAYYDGYLYHSFGQRSYKIDATNGETIWACWTTFQGFSSPTVTGGDVTGLKMYYGNGFYTLNVIDGESGERTAFQTIGSQIISSPAIWENKVYIGGTDFNVYCFQGNAPSF